MDDRDKRSGRNCRVSSPDAGHVREGVRPELLESGDLVKAFVHVIVLRGIFIKLLLFVSASRMLGSPTNQKKLIGPNKNR